MKTLSTLLLLATTASAFCQDVILQQDGSEIQGKVHEIGETTIKYKKASNPDGPFYTISKSKVFMVTFENGSKEVFGASSSNEENKPDNDASDDEIESFDPDNHQQRQAVMQYANSAAEKLKNCCSRWGGKNVRGDVELDVVEYSSYTHHWTIPMTAKWTGSYSGSNYYIKGILTVDQNLRMTWKKIKDSGGFQPSCGSQCL